MQTPHRTTLIQVFNTLAINFTNKVMAALASSHFPGNGPNIFKNIFNVDWPDGCGGTVKHPADCEDFSCDTILSGVGLPYNAINRWTPWNHMNPYRMLNALTEFADDETVNIYAKDGYDALRVGCLSNNNCDNANYPDAAPVSPGATAAIVVVVLLVVAAAVGFFVWRRFKPSSDMPAMSASTQESAETYGSTVM